jgi:ribosomal protein S12 methylthiotransferase
MPRVGIVSLGCPKNLVDSEVMLGTLKAHGYELTPRADEADVIIVNTCGFIEPAKRESIDAILEMAEYKKFGMAKRLVVAGCLVERFRRDILEQIPEVDSVIGTNELERIAEACTGLDEPSRRISGPDGLPQIQHWNGNPVPPYLYDHQTPRVLSTPFYSAYLKIAEGCDHPCTFCVIPQMRGGFRSRRFESVVREAENLVKAGVRELTLVGQDTTSYGHDLGLRAGLAHLLRQLGRISGLVWLRFLYCYPNLVDDALIDAVAETDTVCKYFDIPLQHASSAVLKNMHRGSNHRQFLRMLGKIRAAIPNVALRTSLIVGFPGETEDDFRVLMDFVAEAEFDHLGVFLYSNEESSASFSLPHQVASRTAKRRQKELMSLQRRISRRKLRQKIGQCLPVLIEGRSEESDLLFRGRLASQAPEIDSRVLINDFEGSEPTAGEFRWATVTGASDYDLIAKLENREFAQPASVCQTTTARVPGAGLVSILPAPSAGLF